MCLEVVTTGKMWQKAAHTESLPYYSLTRATSDHEKEEKMWCKRWNGFWLIDERSQKKWVYGQQPNSSKHLSSFCKWSYNTYSMGIQQKGQRLICVKLSTKARIFLLASCHERKHLFMKALSWDRQQKIIDFLRLPILTKTQMLDGNIALETLQDNTTTEKIFAYNNNFRYFLLKLHQQRLSNFFK